MQKQNLTQYRMPLPGGDIDVTGINFYHRDYLGSMPLVSSRGGRASVAARLFAPYGESYNNVGITGDLNFTGDYQDLVAGTFDTPNRELNPTQGRWISPDPAHASWNAYSYTTNPMLFRDPTGLIMCVCGGGGGDGGDPTFYSGGGYGDGDDIGGGDHLNPGGASSLSAPSRGDLVGCRRPLASFHRFRLRARLGPPWPTEISPLTDPTVQISRSGFLKRYSPPPTKGA
jgi:RHS repeat-associated protein